MEYLRTLVSCDIVHWQYCLAAEDEFLDNTLCFDTINVLSNTVVCIVSIDVNNKIYGI